jgi:hypothetical protein
MAYATVDDLEDFLENDPMPNHPERLLDRASERVDEMMTGFVYETSDAGLPTDASVIDLLKNLTILQAQYMGDVGDETGSRSGFTSMSTGGVSWSRAVGQGNGRPINDRYAPNAVTYLRTKSSTIRWGIFAL